MKRIDEEAPIEQIKPCIEKYSGKERGMIKIPVNTVLEECKECPFFRLETNNLYMFNRPDILIYKCEHVDICEKAIELYKKHVEAEKEDNG